MKKWCFMFILTTVIGVMMAFSNALPLCAEEESDEEEFTLEEIIVTAQKREENQQKVPIAMEVISGEDLTLSGKDNVDEILWEVSNVLINTSEDGMRISLRGITDEGGMFQNLHTTTPTVAVNIDGAYNNMSNAGQNLYDLERVEVLFGPQSTMYASNSPGGIVNIVTASPKTDRFSVSGSVQYGSFRLLNYQGTVNAPVFKDKVALRLSANKSRQSSWVSPDSEGRTSTSARLRALYQPYDKLSLTLTGNWSKSGSGGMMGGSVVAFEDQDDVDDPWTTTGSDSQGGGNQSDQITKGVSADIAWDTWLGALTIAPSYSKSSSDGTSTGGAGGAPPDGGGGPPPGMAMSFDSNAVNIMPQQDEEEEDETTAYTETYNVQKGAEVRMSSPKNFTWFSWIAGATYYESEQHRVIDYVDEDSDDTDSSNTQARKGLFANITYPVWFHKKLSFTLGYRQSWDETENVTSEGAAPGREAGTRVSDQDYSDPDFKYGMQYDLADNFMLYANYSSSYRINSMGSEIADPETMDSYSGGAKTRWFGNKLQVNVSTYFYDYKNKYVNQAKILNNASEAFYQADLNGDGDMDDTIDNLSEGDNAKGYGDFKSIGVDVQTNWIISSKDRLNLSVSYLRAKWYDLNFDFTYDMIWPDESYDGEDNTYSPTWSMTASYSHNFTLGSFGSLRPQISMQHKTSYKMHFNPESLDVPGYAYQEPYYLWDVSASFSHSSGRWSMSANVKNVTNYAVKTSLRESAGGGGVGLSMMVGDPRTYSAVLSVNF